MSYKLSKVQNFVLLNLFITNKLKQSTRFFQLSLNKKINKINFKLVLIAKRKKN